MQTNDILGRLSQRHLRIASQSILEVKAYCITFTSNAGCLIDRLIYSIYQAASVQCRKISLSNEINGSLAALFLKQWRVNLFQRFNWYLDNLAVVGQQAVNFTLYVGCLRVNGG